MWNRRHLRHTLPSPLALAAMLSLAALAAIFLTTPRTAAIEAVPDRPSFIPRRSFGTASIPIGSIDAGLMERGPGTDRTFAVVTGSKGGQNKLYLGDDAGQFTTPSIPIGTGSDPTTAVVLVDVDDNDRTDVVVGNNGTPSAIYHNRGQGSFNSDSTINCNNPTKTGVTCLQRTDGSLEVTTTSLRAGDVNGDRRPDIVLGRSDGSVVLYRNKGGNPVTFDLIQTVRQASEATVTSVKLAYVFTDKPEGGDRFDLIIGTSDKLGNAGTVLLFPNKANQTATAFFDEAQPVDDELGPNITSIDVGRNRSGDFTAIVVGVENGKIWAYPPQEDHATFDPDQRKEVSDEAIDTKGISVADINDDGCFDVVAATTSQGVTIFQQSGPECIGRNPARDFTAKSREEGDRVLPPDALDVVATDLDGDAYSDIAAVGQGWARIQLNQAFQLNETIGGPTDQITSLAIADVGDGRVNVRGDAAPDIVTGKRQGFTTVYFNSGKEFRPDDSFSFFNPFFEGPFDPPILPRSIQITGTTNLAVGNVVGTDKPDIVANRFDGKTSVFSGTDGTAFAFANDLDISQSSSIAIADVTPPDSDALDIVVGTSGQPGAIFHNGNKRPFGGATPTKSIVVQDINQDDRADIVVGNKGQRSVVLLQKQDQSFAQSEACDPATLPNGTEPQVWCFGNGNEQIVDIALGDVGGDGDIDIVAANAQGQSMLYGNGNPDPDGTFVAIPFGGAQDAITTVAIGDLNGDSLPNDQDGNAREDIVAGTGQWVQVYVQRRDPTNPDPNQRNRPIFGTATGDIDCADHQSVPAGVHCIGDVSGTVNDVAVEDMDGDGARDIVAARDGQSRIYYNRVGRFQSPTFLESQDWSSTAVAGDIDSDGDLDMVVGSWYGQSRVYYNDGTGIFTATAKGIFGGAHDLTNSVAAGDMNHDGRLDIVVGNSFGPSLVYLQHKDGTFARQTGVCGQSDDIRCFDQGEHSTQAVAIADINRDGYPDIVAAKNRQSAVHLNNGTGYFTATVERRFAPESQYLASVAVADVNGDQKLDIVAGAPFEQSAVYLQVNGGFSTNVSCDQINQVWCLNSPDSNDFDSVAAGDVDGNGDADIVVGGPGGGVFINQRGQIPNGSAPFAWEEGQSSSSILSLGDMDGDGSLDTVTKVGTQNAVILRRQGPELTIPFDSAWRAALVVADVNGDAALDIVAIGQAEASRVYLNDSHGVLPVSATFGAAPITSIALTDLDIDAKDDPMYLVTGDNVGSQLQLYRADVNNDRELETITTLPPLPMPNDGIPGRISSVAMGDMNGDRKVDIVASRVGTGFPVHNSILVYRGDGAGNFAQQLPFEVAGGVQSIALGDVNYDGYLDVITAVTQGQSRIYLNNRNGGFGTAPGLVKNFGLATDNFQSIVLADIDADGSLDIVAGNTYDGRFNRQSQVFFNDGAGGFDNSETFGGGQDAIAAIAVADMNRDGALDIVAGNMGQPSVIYYQQSGGTFYADVVDDCFEPPTSVRCYGDAEDEITSLATGDFNGDKIVDLVVGLGNDQSRIYLGDKRGPFIASRLLDHGDSNLQTAALTVGDVNRDGAPDVVAGRSRGPAAIYLNHVHDRHLVNNPPRLLVGAPVLENRTTIAPTTMITSQIVSIPFYLADTEGDPVRVVTAEYSLDGGANWQPAISADQPRLAYTTQQLGIGQPYIYRWNTNGGDAKSRFFGQSDDVVVRIVVSPSGQPGTGAALASFQRPYTAGQSAHFRARGTQIRVLTERRTRARGPNPKNERYLPMISTRPLSGLHISEPITNTAGAFIYRLEAPNTRGAERMRGDGERALVTDERGYLQGHGELKQGDCLIALLPVTPSGPTQRKFTLYYTSAIRRARTNQPCPGMKLVDGIGEQRLVVSNENPLLAFDLSVSLEWDASDDVDFRQRLESDLKRASELLYVWSGGQVALGNIIVNQNKIEWDTADIQILASNRVRPNATQGGVTDENRPDPNPRVKLVYSRGSIRTGPTWNRFGDAGSSLGDDWPRALAHELGHYLLYLDDTYLGVRNQQLVPIETCPGPMNDPYRDYDDFILFNGQRVWRQNQACLDTLPAKHTGRWDWETISAFYPWLVEPWRGGTPNSLLFNVTDVRIQPGPEISATPRARAPEPSFTESTPRTSHPRRSWISAARPAARCWRAARAWATKSACTISVSAS
jgi:hypothetical protein